MKFFSGKGLLFFTFFLSVKRKEWWKMENKLLAALIGRFRNQDMNAFTVIYDEFKGLIYHYSGKLCDDDAVQELTLFLIELLYSIELSRFAKKEGDGLKRYIAIALKNKYIAISKANTKCNAVYQNPELYDNGYCDITSGITVKEALQHLSPKQRLIIVYKYIYCFPDCEIAKMLDISRQAVNRLKNRGLTMLKEFYSE